jgi:hypothetical protein
MFEPVPPKNRLTLDTWIEEFGFGSASTSIK